MAYGIENLLDHGLPAAAAQHPVTFWRVGKGKLHLSEFCPPRHVPIARVGVPLPQVRTKDLCARCGHNTALPSSDIDVVLGAYTTLVGGLKVLARPRPSVAFARTCENRARQLGWDAGQVPDPGFVAEASAVRTRLLTAARDTRAGLSVDETLWAEAAMAALLVNSSTLAQDLIAGTALDTDLGRWASVQALSRLTEELLDLTPWERAEQAALAAAATAVGTATRTTGVDTAAELTRLLRRARSRVQDLATAGATEYQAGAWVLLRWAGRPSVHGLNLAVGIAAPVVDASFDPGVWRLAARVPAGVAAVLVRHPGPLVLPAEAGDTAEVARTALALPEHPVEAFRTARLIHAPAA